MPKTTHLYITHEPIVAIEMHRAELPHAIELEGDSGRVGSRVVPPADPGRGLGGLADLVAAELAVH